MGTSEEGSKARNQSTLKKEEKNSMMKTFGLLILICSILDIGISNPNKHFLVETSDIADGDEAKPATNINIKEASITMGENENGKGDYQNNVNQGPIATGVEGRQCSTGVGGSLGFVSILGFWLA